MNQSPSEQPVYPDAPSGHLSVTPVGPSITRIGYAIALIGSHVTLGRHTIPLIRLRAPFVTRLLGQST